jgi:two-component system sensor histidine kinase CpxA
VRGIALKIFVSFWVIFVVLIASFALLRDTRGDGRFLDHLRQHGTTAAALLEQQGARGCADYAAIVAARNAVDFALFDGNSIAVCAAADMDPRLLRQFAGVVSGSVSDSNIARISVRAPSGATLTAAGAPRDGFATGAVPPPFPIRAVAYAILVSGLVCFATARYLARPLQRVRDASYRLAAGDLQARAGPAVGRRRDEIGELVRDFDAMAARIEALVHAQTQLLSDISHELRSPLARLNVALELARRKAGSDAAGDLQRIEVEAERMNELIGRVLALARAESDPHPPMAPVDLEAIVEDVVEDARYEAQRQDKSVDLHLEATPVVLGHASLVASAIDNVVRNGLRYTPSHSTVVVELAATPTEATIRVRDHGPGIPEAELEKIFSPFHRIESGRDRERGGVGLGLAIARRAVVVHSGTIVAENDRDGGLLVTIRLPIDPSAGNAVATS